MSVCVLVFSLLQNVAPPDRFLMIYSEKDNILNSVQNKTHVFQPSMYPFDGLKNVS